MMIRCHDKGRGEIIMIEITTLSRKPVPESHKSYDDEYEWTTENDYPRGRNRGPT